MKLPIPAGELAGLLPHREPMVWVDHILSASAAQGSTEVTLTRPLMLNRGRMHVGGLVEFVAQSYAFLRALDARQRRLRLQTAQLAAIDRFELVSRYLPREEETIIAELQTIRDLDPLYLAEGRVFAPDRRIVCVMKFKGHAVSAIDEGA